MAKKKTTHKARSAENVESSEKLQYHLKVKPGDLSPTVLIPGDPKRVRKIAKYWDHAQKVAEYRQYISYTGMYKKSEISAVSSGIGPAASEIALTELKNVGTESIIRVGSCGVLKEDIGIGDLVISEASVRLEDTSHHYVMREYPAIASRMITSALIQACEENNIAYHVGITASSSSFYVGQGREYSGYLPSHRKHLLEDLSKANVMNFEMEASLMFILGKIFNMNVGAICAVYANRITNEFGVKGELKAIKAANEAVRILNDYSEKRIGKYWY